MSLPDQPESLADTRRLAALFSLDAHASEAWDASDLAAILKHQLQTPVDIDLGTLPAEVAPKVHALADADGLTLRNFNDLFLHPHPPLHLLRLVKDFAKRNRVHTRSAIPPEVATVIYYAAIVVASMRCRQKISGLEPLELLKGIEWALAQPWLDPSLRGLFKYGPSALPIKGLKLRE